MELCAFVDIVLYNPLRSYGTFRKLMERNDCTKTAISLKKKHRSDIIKYMVTDFRAFALFFFGLNLRAEKLCVRPGQRYKIRSFPK